MGLIKHTKYLYYDEPPVPLSGSFRDMERAIHEIVHDNAAKLGSGEYVISLRVEVVPRPEAETDAP